MRRLARTIAGSGNRSLQTRSYSCLLRVLHVSLAAVYGFSGAGYTITASTGMITLEDGIQQYGATAAGQYSYFRFIAT